VKVAVIDSGIDGDHPDVGGVAGAAIVEPDPDAPSGARVTEEAHGDLYGHGTACAGIIRRMAPDVQLYSVRVLSEKLTGRGSVFARGLDWCIANGMHVVNLSLSTSSDEYFGLFHELCDQAVFARVMLVSALANERKATYPSEFSSVFSVAAMDGADLERFCCNPVPPAEWGAPGIDVRVAWLAGASITATGNSFAAPVIAGHLARLVAQHPAITPYQAKTVLAALADNAPRRP